MSLKLPGPVAAYLAAEKAKNADMLALCFADDALVHEEGYTETDAAVGMVNEIAHRTGISVDAARQRGQPVAGDLRRHCGVYPRCERRASGRSVADRKFEYSDRIGRERSNAGNAARLAEQTSQR